MRQFYFILLFTISCSGLHLEEPHKRYVRKDWKHWIDDDRNCLNTRAEMLKRHSLTPVTYNKKGCKVLTGKWQDFYHNQFHTIAKQVDIDHVVPLKNAHISGGANWSKRSKEEFANDPENLVITDRTYNRKKGAKGIDEWLPVTKEYACKYVKKWISIKNKYSLKLLEGEQRTVRLLKKDCQL